MNLGLADGPGRFFALPPFRKMRQKQASLAGRRFINKDSCADFQRTCGREGESQAGESKVFVSRAASALFAHWLTEGFRLCRMRTHSGRR